MSNPENGPQLPVIRWPVPKNNRGGEFSNLEEMLAHLPTNIRSSSKNKTCCRLWNYKRHYFFYNEKQR